jgi:hypothetical protein
LTRRAGQSIQLNPSLTVPAKTSLQILQPTDPRPIKVTGAGRSVSGGGLLQTGFALERGATLQPGDDFIGQLTVQGDVELASDAEWDVAIFRAEGSPVTDWNFLAVSDSLQTTAAAGQPISMRVLSLGANGQAGPLAGFQASAPREWLIAEAGDLDAFLLSRLVLDTAEFRILNQVSPDRDFYLQIRGQQLWLNYDVAMIPGDLNDNGQLDTADIDELSAAIRLSITDPRMDFNGDDLVDQADHAYWVHRLKETYSGDANLDGQFSSADLVQVFAVGQYEDPLTTDSVWATGDWNGDGTFTSGDLIAAFADGAYEQGPRMSRVYAVAEPGSSLLLWLAIFGVLAGRHQQGNDLSHIDH